MNTIKRQDATVTTKRFTRIMLHHNNAPFCPTDILLSFYGGKLSTVNDHLRETSLDRQNTVFIGSQAISLQGKIPDLPF